MKLYIIGNGFDLAHNLNTRYSDYKDYIKKNLPRHWKWEKILDFYPNDYKFWSDIEYNVCKINRELYLKLKEIYGFGLLDDLERQIHISFENFILAVESEVLKKKPIFQLDKDSLFISFNYTTLLEDVYHVDKKNIVYIHNDISGPAMEILYNIHDHTPCIIGHSPIRGDYVLHDDDLMKKEKEYLDYVENTTKRCEEIMNSRNLDVVISSNCDKITEIVFYGFSFSITDKIYIRYLFNKFSKRDVLVKIYYKVESDQTENITLSLLKEKLNKIGIDSTSITFINCESTKEI